MEPRVFVDTNLLVYRHDLAEPHKQERAADWLEWLWREKNGHLSIQVLEEFYATVTRKLKPGLAPEQAQERCRPYFAWRPVPLTPPLLDDAWRLEARYSLSFWDALILAAARSADCEWLLTEDLDSGSELGGVTVVDPFSTEPGALGR